MLHEKQSSLSENRGLRVFVCLSVLGLGIFTACASQTSHKAQPSGNRVFFQMDLAGGAMNVQADYTRKDVKGNDFFLNRDFTITRLLVDGKPINPETIKEQLVIPDLNEYLVNVYHLPDFKKGVSMEYRGILSGESGSSPYVRETISEDFTFLRMETYCYPLFASPENIFAELLAPFGLTMSVQVPKDYVVQFTGGDVAQKETKEGIIYTLSGNMLFYQYAAAIARYQKLDYDTGVYYFLPGTDTEKVSEIIDPVMTRANAFMQEHFGERVFSQKFRVVEIPENFGSFANTEEHMTFVQASSFGSGLQMQELIHEFIHLGWNTKIPEDMEVAMVRFFDEAFASYFTWRVMSDLLGKDGAQGLLERFTRTYEIEDLGSIMSWGVKDHGDLSYTIGALCLYKLSVLVGEETFDRVTKDFLQKYQNISPTFEDFCAEYERQCPDVDVKTFFQKWIYSDAYVSEIYL